MNQFRDLIEARKRGSDEGDPEDRNPSASDVPAATPESGEHVVSVKAVPSDDASQSTDEDAEARSAEPAEAQAHTPAEQPETLTEAANATIVGKRSDPAFRLVSVYLQKETHHRLKLELLLDAQRSGERPQDMSQLVEALLQRWLASRSGAKNGSNDAKMYSTRDGDEAA